MGAEAWYNEEMLAMLCWITILGGVLIMMGQHSRSEALFYYFRLEVREALPPSGTTKFQRPGGKEGTDAPPPHRIAARLHPSRSSSGELKAAHRPSRAELDALFAVFQHRAPR